MKKNYSGDAIKFCAEALGRTAESVKHAAERLSITAKHEHLTTDEQAYICEWYSTKGSVALSRIMGKKRNTIHGFAMRKGLRMNPEDLKRVKGENAPPVVFTAEVRAKIGAAQRKYDSPHTCQDCGKVIKKRNQKRCNVCSLKSRAGESHMWWKGGKTNFYTTIANKLWRSWKRDILARDGYVCTKCGSKQNLHVHHLDRMSDIRDRVLTDNPGLSVESNKEELADLIIGAHKNARGVTLCKKCHREIHFANGVNCWEARQGNQQASRDGNAPEAPTTNGYGLKQNAMAMNRHERTAHRISGMI